MTDPFEQAGSAAPGDGAYSADGKPDRYGRYKLVDPATGEVRPYTRATTFAKSISDTFTLSQWSQRMVAKGLSMRPDLVAAAAALAVTDREKLNKVAETAKETAGAKTGANLGTAIHAFTEQLDKGETVTAPPPYDRHVAAYATALADAGIEVVPEFIEQTVAVPDFGGIAGTFDRVVWHEGRHKILDLKTGRDLEYGWMEIVVQLAIYANAPAYFDKKTKMWVPLPADMDLGTALVVHLPAQSEAKATVHEVDINAGWDIAKLCHAVRQARKRKGLSRTLTIAEVDVTFAGDQFGPSTEQGAPLIVSSERVRQAVATRDATILELIAGARTVPDLATIRSQAMLDRTWTPAVEQKAIERRDAILADTAAG